MAMELEREIDQSKPFANEHHKLLVNLLYTAGHVSLSQHRAFKQFGLTSQQYNVLRILRGRRPAAATVQYISARMLDRSSNTSRLIDKLVAKNYVERRICPNNRRAVDLTITTEGLELLSQLDAHEAAWIGPVHHLDETEARQLNALLDKLRGPDRPVPPAEPAIDYAASEDSEGSAPC